MRKAIRSKRKPEMLAEYDFSQGIRGQNARRYAAGNNIVVLSPDVAEFFPNADAVNAALRALVEIAMRKNGKRGTAIWWD
jgi:hypothetical protein